MHIGDSHRRATQVMNYIVLNLEMFTYKARKMHLYIDMVCAL
jgi:hypothetical protein